VTDASNGQDWAAPGGAIPTAPAHVPDVVSAAAPPPPLAVPAAAHAPLASPTFRSWQPGIIPLRPVSFGEFLAVPFKAIRFNRAVVLGGPLLFVALAMVLLAATLWLAFTDPSLALTSPYAQFQGVQATTIIALVLTVVAIVLADALSSAVVAPGVARAVLGEKISLGEALKALRERLGSLLLLWFLAGAATIASLIPGAIVIAVSGGDGGAIAIGIVLLLVLSLVVSVPVYIITAIARCVIVLEKRGAVASVRRTIGLIRGRFWWSVLIIGLTALLINIVTGIFQQLLSFVGAIALAVGASAAWLGGAIFVLVLVLGAVITYVITYAYMGSIYAFIYIDARIRHEGFDLDLARAAEARRA
jgi:hypothetical protein